eukprot:TRINITY_DN15579_c0_g1_i1.p1 TRINITY_DN15579_c0_g1~~TRINITY_DN15579_c0_g1_i1.p1  ORF type:complete len:1161 (+),score=236.54 TRINITY_DN15579_c0_g1_i1:59-3541(+)
MTDITSWSPGLYTSPLDVPFELATSAIPQVLPAALRPHTLPPLNVARAQELADTDNWNDLPAQTTRIPEKFHLFEVSPMRFKDADRSAFLDEERKTWKRLAFPSLYPSSRKEAVILSNTFDTMLQELHAKESPRADGASAQQQIDLDYERGQKELAVCDVVLAEVIRQVHTNCAERGALLDRLRHHVFGYYDCVDGAVTLYKRRAERAVQRLKTRTKQWDAERTDMQKTIDDLKAQLADALAQLPSEGDEAAADTATSAVPADGRASANGERPSSVRSDSPASRRSQRLLRDDWLLQSDSDHDNDAIYVDTGTYMSDAPVYVSTDSQTERDAPLYETVEADVQTDNVEDLTSIVRDMVQLRFETMHSLRAAIMPSASSPLSSEDVETISVVRMLLQRMYMGVVAGHTMKAVDILPIFRQIDGLIEELRAKHGFTPDGIVTKRSAGGKRHMVAEADSNEDIRSRHPSLGTLLPMGDGQDAEVQATEDSSTVETQTDADLLNELSQSWGVGGVTVTKATVACQTAVNQIKARAAEIKARQEIENMMQLLNYARIFDPEDPDAPHEVSPMRSTNQPSYAAPAGLRSGRHSHINTPAELVATLRPRMSRLRKQVDEALAEAVLCGERPEVLQHYMYVKFARRGLAMGKRAPQDGMNEADDNSNMDWSDIPPKLTLQQSEEANDVVLSIAIPPTAAGLVPSHNTSGSTSPALSPRASPRSELSPRPSDVLGHSQTAGSGISFQFDTQPVALSSTKSISGRRSHLSTRSTGASATQVTGDLSMGLIVTSVGSRSPKPPPPPPSMEVASVFMFTETVAEPRLTPTSYGGQHLPPLQDKRSATNEDRSQHLQSHEADLVGTGAPVRRIAKAQQAIDRLGLWKTASHALLDEEASIDDSDDDETEKVATPGSVTMRPVAAIATIPDVLTFVRTSWNEIADSLFHTRRWILQLARFAYERKVEADHAMERVGNERLLFCEVIWLVFNRRSNEDSDATNKRLKHVVQSVKAHCARDVTVEMFGKFLLAENGWDDQCLQLYIAAMSLLDVLTDGVTYPALRGVKEEDRDQQSFVCLVRASSVVQTLLPGEHSQRLIAQMAACAVPADGNDMKIYTSKRSRMGAMAFRKMQRTLFLSLLCRYVAQLEPIERKQLPDARRHVMFLPHVSRLPLP